MGAIASALVIGLVGLLPVLVIPLASRAALSDAMPANMRRLVGLAAGGLLGDVFLHILPEVWGPRASFFFLFLPFFFLPHPSCPVLSFFFFLTPNPNAPSNNRLLSGFTYKPTRSELWPVDHCWNHGVFCA